MQRTIKTNTSSSVSMALVSKNMQRNYNKYMTAQHTLDDVSTDSHRLGNTLNNVLRQWKRRIIVVHIDQIHYQLQEQHSNH